MIHNVRTVKPASIGVAVPKTRVTASARPSVAANFKITLETPDGTETVECEGGQYIVDAAEVRHSPVQSRLQTCAYPSAGRTGLLPGILLCAPWAAVGTVHNLVLEALQIAKHLQ